VGNRKKGMINTIGIVGGGGGPVRSGAGAGRLGYPFWRGGGGGGGFSGALGGVVGGKGR